jgi:hypothetical protein
MARPGALALALLAAAAAMCPSDPAAAAETWVAAHSKSLGARPENATVLDHLGDLLLARGKRTAALDEWRKALADPDLEDGLKAAIEAKIKDAERPSPS